MTWELLGLTGRNLQSAVTIVGIAAVTNAACALVGCYLILRRMSLLGDAIAHAVLPGLVLAYVFSGSLSLPALYLGAIVTGLLTAALTQTLHRYGGVAEDTSMGVVFTSLFALGVVLIKLFGHHVDLDPDCVLSGLLELADDNLVNVGGVEVPRGLVTVLPVLGMNLAVILIFWKELLVASFDPGFASAVGFRPGVLHYVLMALVAVTTVASFEQVGSILVIAMLIVPGATAHLLTDRLRTMLATAVVLGVFCAVLGFAAAVWWDVSIAGRDDGGSGRVLFTCSVIRPLPWPSVAVAAAVGTSAADCRRGRACHSLSGRRGCSRSAREVGRSPAEAGKGTHAPSRSVVCSLSGLGSPQSRMPGVASRWSAVCAAGDPLAPPVGNV